VGLIAVGLIRLQLVHLGDILQGLLEDLLQNAIPDPPIQDRKGYFDALEEVSGHPISTGHEDRGIAGVFKTPDAAVL
jgi:hypothetical protein